uniref:RAB, member of RAS oncogene family like 2B n=1 Tax=Monodelphis domestica TaxID=13616 RepID=A0A5F8GEL4_MONDO
MAGEPAGAGAGAGTGAGAGAGAGTGPELDQEKYDSAENVKIICLGDSAVGKSKLMERFLMDGFQPQQLSTYALTLYKHTTTVDGKTILVDFWDTAGQERFQSMHASYYHKAHACIMVFDVQRKVTYKNLGSWYSELREFRPEIPCIVVANKIDADTKVTQKSFNFARKFSLPLYFVSAADGTNVVKLFNDAIRLAVSYKQNSQDFMDEVLQELELPQHWDIEGGALRPGRYIPAGMEEGQYQAPSWRQSSDEEFVPTIHTHIHTHPSLGEVIASHQHHQDKK